MKLEDNLGEFKDFDPTRLHWVGTPSIGVTFFETIDLNRGEHAFLDVLNTKPDSSGEAHLFSAVLLEDKSKELPLSICRMQITIHGDDVEPCTKEYSISWKGLDYTDIRLKLKKSSRK